MNTCRHMTKHASINKQITIMKLELCFIGFPYKPLPWVRMLIQILWPNHWLITMGNLDHFWLNWLLVCISCTNHLYGFKQGCADMCQVKSSSACKCALAVLVIFTTKILSVNKSFSQQDIMLIKMLTGILSLTVYNLTLGLIAYSGIPRHFYSATIHGLTTFQQLPKCCV